MNDFYPLLPFPCLRKSLKSLRNAPQVGGGKPAKPQPPYKIDIYCPTILTLLIDRAMSHASERPLQPK